MVVVGLLAFVVQLQEPVGDGHGVRVDVHRPVDGRQKGDDVRRRRSSDGTLELADPSSDVPDVAMAYPSPDPATERVVG